MTSINFAMSTATNTSPGQFPIQSTSIKDELKNVARMCAHSSSHVANANMVETNQDKKVCA